MLVRGGVKMDFIMVGVLILSYLIIKVFSDWAEKEVNKL